MPEHIFNPGSFFRVSKYEYWKMFHIKRYILYVKSLIIDI